ncbi:S1C family serine protease [Kribbella solani]|uniref:Putative serine protease PepD n=1 Tax=Kribbella solani TaxID=236067 RepID=A0A841DT76_9ACTN|nr:trypsin-like peptidase domain-containing protein [Kribbella solani]MBB5979527.1 putative serine protease PepD [Kribbella solani]
MVQADSGSTGPVQGRRPTRLLLVAAGVAVGALVTALIFLVVQHDNTAGATPSAGSGDSAAMCAAIPVANQVLPSIVTISAQRGGQSGTLSGQVFRAGGYVLTNDHVISVAAGAGGKVSVRYSDGQTSDATIVGRDPSTDLAVLKAADEAKNKPVIALGSSANLQVGQPVVALGAPLGLASTVTTGIVSALDRYVPVPGEGVTHHLIGAIQTDAAINPGNSGGALVDCAGNLVGVNAAIATVPNAGGVAGGGSVGLGFAIPVDVARPVADQLISTGKPGHPTTGLQVQTIPQALVRQSGVAGLFVLAAEGPGAEAGLRAGDIITQIDGKPATNSEQLVVATLTRKAGDKVELQYVRSGTPATTTLTLAAP